MILQEKTLVSDFFGCPDTWGAVIRTIKPNSGSFKQVTTFGHWIAVANSDCTVAIYDSVTGTLRLSLSVGGDIQAIRGSQDGSTLFCIYNRTSITGWDIQTGGPIHTFLLSNNVGDIAICSKGRYLALGLLNGSVKIWEVASRLEVATLNGDLFVSHLCWLEPGKQLMVVGRRSARVWDVVAGRILLSFTTDDEIYGVAYAQRLDRFAIATTSGANSTITVVDPNTGTSFIHRIPHQTSCLGFSPATDEFVCCVGTHGVGLFSVPARSWRQFDHLSRILSISTLLNGTVVAKVDGSSIQLLSLDEGNPPPRQPTTSLLTLDTLDEGYSPPQQPTTSILTLNTFDEGSIIAILPSNCHRDHIVLLELATMSKIQTIPTVPSGDHSNILCASLKHRIVAREYPLGYLQLWRSGDETPSWTDIIEGRILVAGISPSGSRLVVANYNHDSRFVRVWNIENGTRVAGRCFRRHWRTDPLEIRFESEDKFYSHHGTFLTPFTISGSSIIRHKQLPPESQRRYDVDDSREWIVESSKRVCWIPPGYISGFGNSYCWVGHMLIIAGEDGVVRKLTFREPF